MEIRRRAFLRPGFPVGAFFWWRTPLVRDRHSRRENAIGTYIDTICRMAAAMAAVYRQNVCIRKNGVRKIRAKSGCTAQCKAFIGRRCATPLGNLASWTTIRQCQRQTN